MKHYINIINIQKNYLIIFEFNSKYTKYFKQILRDFSSETLFLNYVFN